MTKADVVRYLGRIEEWATACSAFAASRSLPRQADAYGDLSYKVQELAQYVRGLE